jgi:hypothetical protein
VYGKLVNVVSPKQKQANQQEIKMSDLIKGKLAIQNSNGSGTAVVVNGDINFDDDDVANAYNAALQPL